MTEGLRTYEVAALVGCPVSALDRYRRNHGFPPPTIRCGHELLWNQIEVEAWLTEHPVLSEVRLPNTGRSKKC